VSVQRTDRRPRWRREVLYTAQLSTTTKCVMWVLYEHMRDDLKVSMSRSTIAGELGWGENLRRVTEHLSAARSAGFLVTVTEGSYGRTATWRGVIPERPTDPETPTVDRSLTVPKIRRLTDDLADRLSLRKTNRLTDTKNGQGYKPLTLPKIRRPLPETNPEPPAQTDQQLQANPSRVQAVGILLRLSSSNSQTLSCRNL
jgi:hypothetical protein